MEMECFGDLKEDEVASAEELHERNPFRAMYKLWTQVPLDEKLQLESKVRTTKQRGRSIEELFYYMDWMWFQMRSRELMKSSTFRKFEEENHLIQFLLALRDEFEPLKRSLLSRSPIPTLAEAILELQEEEARLRSSNGYIETNATEVEEDDEPLSAYLERRLTFDDEDELELSNLFSFRSMTNEEIRESIYSGSGSTVCNVEELAAAISPARDRCAISG